MKTTVLRRLKLILIAMFCTVCTVSCGKTETVHHKQVENASIETEVFAEQFFLDSNLPYEKINSTEMLTGADEYVFYIPNGVVYRTLHDSIVVIAARKDLHEPSDKVGTDYSGELYPVFDGDDSPLLKYSAAGDYAIMASSESIPDWDDDDVIYAFMDYARK